MKRLTTLILSLGVLACTSANAQFVVIEDFESLTPFPWGAWVGGGSTDASDSYSGAQMFDTESNWCYRDDVSYGVAGDTISCWTKIGTGRTYWGFGASAAGCYSFVAAPNTNDIRFQENPGYGYVELSTTPFVFTVGNWYKMEMIFVTGTDVIGNLYDSDGTTLLVSVAETLPGITPGGFAFRTFGNNKVDYLGATDVCLPTYGFESVAACGSYTVPSGDETYMAGGTVNDTIPSLATGCDSILTITLTVDPMDTASITYPALDYCIDDTINPVPSIDSTMGGSFSAEFGLLLDPSTGEIDVDGSSAGTYNVQYLTTGTCPDSMTVVFNVNPLPVISSATVTDEMTGSDGMIDLTVTSGTPAYTFDWDNDGTGDFDDDEDPTGLDAGTYSVVVVDSKGCQTSMDSIVVGSQVGIGENSIEFTLFPNPTRDNLTVKVSNGEFNYTLANILGEVVLTGKATTQEMLNLADLTNGVYLLTLRQGEAVSTVKVVKK